MRRLHKDIDPYVFWGSASLIAAFVAWGLLAPTSLGSVMTATLGWIVSNFGWGFILIATGGLLLCIFLVLHPWGSIRLGPDDSRPEFRTFSWVSMMFAAGLGAGLLFYGTAEPISHWSAPPHGLAEPRSEEAAAVALRYTYFHWGFNGWALYAIMGGALAYFSFRRGTPMLVSATFSPLLGEGAHLKPLGRTIDALAIVATLFGTATSLGLGAKQINSGLNYLFQTGETIPIALTIIAVMTVLFILSAVTGVGKGIQFLSNVNMVLALLLVLFLAGAGPTVFILNTLTQAVGDYVSGLVPMAFRTAAFSDGKWLGSWTIFYWAWWISWAPFVGVFIARISKGRTIREFMLGVLLLPSAVTFVWFAVFGGVALHSELHGAGGIVEAVNDQGPAVALFALLGQYPLALVTSGLAIFLVAIFFISGADAGSVVMGMLSSRGSLTPRAPIVVLWGALAGASAGVLLLMGGLEALQTASIIAAAPFLFVMIGLCASLWRSLLDELGPAPVATHRGGGSHGPLIAPVSMTAGERSAAAEGPA